MIDEVGPGRRTPEVVPTSVKAALTAADEPVCAFVYDVAGMAARATAMRATLPLNVTLCYAVKANAHPAVLRALGGVLDGFDVASGGELAKAHAAAPGARLLFAGPGKTDADLAAALRAGVSSINAESRLDLARIDHVAASLGVTADVLLRVNPRDAMLGGSLVMAGAATQFGIDAAELPAALADARRLRHVRVVGLHLHAVSNNLSAADHLRFVEWAVALEPRLPVLNLGGGFGLDYGGTGRHFGWESFVAGLPAVSTAAAERELIFEPGRFVVGPLGWYAATVLDVKANHGRTFAVLRGGSHHFRLPVAYRLRGGSFPQPAILPIDRWRYPFARPEVSDMPVTFAGELCTTSDVLAVDVPVSRLRVGDVVVFELAGAYGWEISHRDFLSHPHPDVMLLH